MRAPRARPFPAPDTFHAAPKLAAASVDTRTSAAGWRGLRETSGSAPAS